MEHFSLHKADPRKHNKTFRSGAGDFFISIDPVFDGIDNFIYFPSSNPNSGWPSNRINIIFDVRIILFPFIR